MRQCLVFMLECKRGKIMRATDIGAIRKYCLENQGGIFDTGYLLEHSFKFINKDSFRKFVSRLVNEGIISQISKGIYYIGNLNTIDLDAMITNHYASNNVGMIVGLSFLNKLNLASKKPIKTDIYSRLTTSNKNIANCSVKIIYSYLVAGTVSFFESLDLLLNYKNIDFDEEMNFANELSKRLIVYNDHNLQLVDMKDKDKYPRYIYLELAKQLNKFHISNRVMEWYEAKDVSSFEEE